jgi:Predicted Zn-dependent protease (DUF2268)
MKNKIIIGFITVLCLTLLGFIGLKGEMYLDNENNFTIETSDIDRFWSAYNSLEKVNTTSDSIDIIQQLYLDKMSKTGKDFIKIRKYTADEYIKTIRKHPKYFLALRIKTKEIGAYKVVIDSTLKKLQAAIPDYKIPDICFAIGCFRGGGTTKKGLILIGSEIALADSTMDYSEFKGWLYTLLSKSDGNIAALIAHESIHCQQKNGQNRTLLSLALQEGAADFLPELILNTNINQITKTYGIDHECDLWKEFKPHMNENDISKWLFNSSSSTERPADLGYFIGMRICEAYYSKQMDKNKAIADLLDRGKYLQVMQQSGYMGNCPLSQGSSK